MFVAGGWTLGTDERFGFAERTMRGRIFSPVDGAGGSTFSTRKKCEDISSARESAYFFFGIEFLINYIYF